jgi:hypothetical protein
VHSLETTWTSPIFGRLWTDWYPCRAWYKFYVLTVRSEKSHSTSPSKQRKLFKKTDIEWYYGVLKNTCACAVCAKLETTEITLSCLDTQWGFTDSTPVEGRCVFAYAGILIEELCTSRNQHRNHSRGASIQTLDTIQLHCHLQLRRALWNTVVNTALVLYHFKL